MKKRSIEEIEHELMYGTASSSKNTSKDKAKLLFAFAGFVAVFICALYAVGYVVSVIVDKTDTHATEITAEKECRDKGYAWHAVEGCMTQEMFINNYVDR